MVKKLKADLEEEVKVLQRKIDDMKVVPVEVEKKKGHTLKYVTVVDSPYNGVSRISAIRRRIAKERR